MNSKNSHRVANVTKAKLANCQICANKINYPFCIRSCNIFHPRRRRNAAQRETKIELTPFQKWMNVFLTPVCIQLAANDALTNDMPQFRKNEFAPGLFAVVLAEVAVFGGIGLTLWGAGKVLAKVIHQFQRPQYYPQERERRRRLAKERRTIRKRSTINVAPTGEELLAQWVKVRGNPQEMIRFGSMLCDVEAYVDNSLVRNQYGEIIGRKPGIRGWLAKNCPELHLKYKTIMRYKALAEKFRQAFDLKDPYPATMLLDGNDVCENTVRNTHPEDCNHKVGDKLDVDVSSGSVDKSVLEKKEMVKNLINECNSTGRGLCARLDEMINPCAVPKEIEVRERLSQGFHKRDGFLRKFAKIMA